MQDCNRKGLRFSSKEAQAVDPCCRNCAETCVKPCRKPACSCMLRSLLGGSWVVIVNLLITTHEPSSRVHGQGFRVYGPDSNRTARHVQSSHGFSLLKSKMSLAVSLVVSI